MYEELKQHNKKKEEPNLKHGRWPQQHFSKEDMQMANEYMKNVQRHNHWGDASQNHREMSSHPGHNDDHQKEGWAQYSGG
jgi:hypothetical protein